MRGVQRNEEIDPDVPGEHVLRVDRESLVLVEHDVAAKHVGQVVLVGIDLMNAGSQQPVTVFGGGHDGRTHAKTSSRWINSRLRESIGNCSLLVRGVANNTRVCANRFQ